MRSTETIHGNLLNRRDLTGWNLHPLGPGGQAAYAAYLAQDKAVDDLTKEQGKLETRRGALKKGARPADEEGAVRADETATGALGDPSTSPKARVSYTAGYFDAANRLTQVQNSSPRISFRSCCISAFTAAAKSASRPGNTA